MQTLKGKQFRTESGSEFKILSDRFFPEGEHDATNGPYLDTLREGLLVSATYHGVSVPLITVKGGVVKLNVVEAAGVTLRKAGQISSLLGVAKPRQPVKIEKI